MAIQCGYLGRGTVTRLEKFIKEDALRCSQCDYIPWDKLKNKKLLVTGATARPRKPGRFLAQI